MYTDPIPPLTTIAFANVLGDIPAGQQPTGVEVDVGSYDFAPATGSWTVTDVTQTKDRFGDLEVSALVNNTTDRVWEFAGALVLVRGPDGLLVDSDNAYVANTDLVAGESSFVTVDFFEPYDGFSVEVWPRG